ncbi:MAG: class I SAM-dependent methyltransferase [Pseudomonadota bacterium]
MGKKDVTVEPQYRCCIESRDRYGQQQLGLMSSDTWLTDPKRLVFVLSRYKFVAKMLTGMKNVLEVGCSDGFATRIVCQEVGRVTAIDIDPMFIEDAKKCFKPEFSPQFIVHDMLSSPVPGKYDGIFSLDVIEHIPKSKEDQFLSNILLSLSPNGTLIIGTPSLESQAYASAGSKEGHINCKRQADLKSFLTKYFHNVFIFSMNDEVVHTGFSPMANYLMALCCNPCNG